LLHRIRGIPIGLGQTISQPFIVALMTQLAEVEPDHVVLEVGTGSGYQGAILAHLARKVCTIEIIPPLAEAAAKALRDLGYDNVSVRLGDGYGGWEEIGVYLTVRSYPLLVECGSGCNPVRVIFELGPLGSQSRPRLRY